MEERLRDFAKHFIDSYFLEMDAEWIISHLDINVKWEGMFGDSSVHDYGSIVQELRKGLEERKKDKFFMIEHKVYVNAFNTNLFAIRIILSGYPISTGEESMAQFDINIFLSQFKSGLAIEQVDFRPIRHRNGASYYRALQNAGIQLEILHKFMASGMVVTSDDEDYSVISVDNEVCQLLGYTKEELLEKCGGRLAELIYPEDYRETVAKIGVTLIEKNEYSVRYRMQKKDGTKIWIWDAGMRTLDEEGKPVLRRMLADVTKTEMLRIERDATFENIPGGVAYIQVTGDDFEVVDANDNYFTMLGTRRTLYIGSGVRYTYEEDLPKVREHLLSVSAKHDPVDIEFRVELPKIKDIRWYRMVGRFFSQEEEGPKYIVVMTDVTERHKVLSSLSREKERYRIAMRSTADIVFEYVVDENAMYLYYRIPENCTVDMDDDGKVDNWQESILSQELIHPDDIGKVMAGFHLDQYYTADIRVWDRQHSSKDKKEYVWYHTSATGIYEEGRMVRILGALQNINEQEQLRSMNKELQEIFDIQLIQNYERIIKIHVPTATYIQYVFNVSEYYRGFVKGNHRESIVHMAEQFVHKEDRERYLSSLNLEHMNQLLCSGEQEVTRYFRMLDDSGEYRWKSYRYSFLGGDLNYIVISVQDVNELLEEQNNREETNRRILLDAVAAANKSKDIQKNFYATVTREVREPLEQIRELTKEKAKTITKSELREDLAEINEISQYLSSIFDDMMDLEQMESGTAQFSRDELHLNELIADISDKQRKIAEENQVLVEQVIRVSENRTFYGDEYRLRQIIGNILANSVKYSPRYEKVRFVVKEAENQNGKCTLVVTVEDRGVRIDEEFFDRSYNGDDETLYQERIKEAEGTAFSLILCKKITELMGGSTSITHGNRGVNQFTIRIPLEYSSVVEGKNTDKTPSQKEEKKIHQVDLSGYRILLVENNTKSNKLIAPILRINGAELTIANTVDEAIGEWSKSTDGYYSMILTDRQLSDGSCFDLAKIVRQAPRKEGKNIWIVVMTESVLVDDFKRGFRQGINTNLTKPVDLSRLLQLLEMTKGEVSLC